VDAGQKPSGMTGWVSFRHRATYHSGTNQTVIPAQTKLSFRHKPTCHSNTNQIVILAQNKLSFRQASGRNPAFDLAFKPWMPDRKLPA